MMRSMKRVLIITGAMLSTVLLVVAAWVLAAQAETPQAPATGAVVAAPPVAAEKKDADTLFKDAAGLVEKNPREAIRLYMLGLEQKPDNSRARQELAMLFEKSGLPAEAITQYELINRASGSAESFVALSNALGKAGYAVEAAIKAEEGTGRFPGHKELQRLAALRLSGAGQWKKALPYLQQAVKSDPTDGATMALLGEAYEKEGKMRDALKAYQGALAIDSNLKAAAAGEGRIKSRSLVRPGFVLIPSEGWLPSEKGLWNSSTGQDITVIVDEKGTPAEVATKLIAERVPKGLFDEGAAEFKEAQIAQIKAHEKKEHNADVTADEATGVLRKIAPSMSGFEKEEFRGNYPGFLVCASYEAGRDGGIAGRASVCALSLTFTGKTISWVMEGGGETGQMKRLLTAFPDGLMETKGGQK
jgi:tetratricopeptide (TPR) repeat protein